MTRFIDIVPIALTPLTPIHVGCGEDFEPTNYVIDGGVLYEFDPAHIPLTDRDRDALLRTVQLEGDRALREMQTFFFERRQQCIRVSRLRVPVAVGVQEWYQARVGKVAQREAGGRNVVNELAIERTAHHAHTGRPYLPGSSIKGSIRTAWLNHVDPSPVIDRGAGPPEERSSDVEKELLGGSFATDPFRLVKVADASGDNVESRVLFSVDRDKEQKISRTGQRSEKNLFVRREVIVGGQLRALTSEIRFDRLPKVDEPQKTPARQKRIRDFEQLAGACNRFYLPKLKSELKLIRRRFADDRWVDRFEQLLAALEPDFDAGRSMLLRVGRHSGAESVTLDKRRWIQIRGGRRRPTFWAREATTIWLAAERENSLAELLPFGWLLVEASPEVHKDALRAWCEEERARWSSQGADRPMASGPQPANLGKPQADEVVWERARLKFNANNGTLTAVGPGDRNAHAIAPRGAELLASLPPELQGKVKRGEFVRVVARVRGSELVGVEVPR